MRAHKLSFKPATQEGDDTHALMFALEPSHETDPWFQDKTLFLAIKPTATEDEIRLLRSDLKRLVTHLMVLE